jgi:hypothetical protein
MSFSQSSGALTTNSGNFSSVFLDSNGLNGIAGSESNAGIYYTLDGGLTWTRSNITTVVILLYYYNIL